MYIQVLPPFLVALFGYFFSFYCWVCVLKPCQLHVNTLSYDFFSASNQLNPQGSEDFKWLWPIKETQKIWARESPLQEARRWIHKPWRMCACLKMLAGWPPPSEGTVREGLSVTPPPSPRALCVPAGLPNPEHTHTPKSVQDAQKPWVHSQTRPPVEESVGTWLCNSTTIGHETRCRGILPSTFLQRRKKQAPHL